MNLTEKQWEIICKEAGTYYVPLWRLWSDYANMKVPLRLYCALKQNEKTVCKGD